MKVATNPRFVDMDQDIALFFALLDFDPLWEPTISETVALVAHCWDSFARKHDIITSLQITAFNDN